MVKESKPDNLLLQERKKKRAKEFHQPNVTDIMQSDMTKVLTYPGHKTSGHKIINTIKDKRGSRAEHEREHF